MTSEAVRPVCDYEGSAYRTEFWGQGRGYEDAAERAALRSLLPPAGRRLIDIGGGYGRLFPLYDAYDEVVLFDYALSQLRQGRELWKNAGPGGRPRYTYVAGDFYRFPFAPGLFDTVVMVRALHHAADAPAVLRGVAEILAADGAFVLEFANKRNLKAILRYLLRQQAWSPFAREPVEFAKLNFDFHPAWAREQLAAVGLRVQRMRAVSYFRVALLKRVAPTGLLVALDRLLQPTGELCQLSPSVFARCRRENAQGCSPASGFFRCTVCGSIALVSERPPGESVGAAGGLFDADQVLKCADCAARFAIRDGIYDFKEPVEVGEK